MTHEMRQSRIDPDPYLVASVWLQAGTMALQMLATWKMFQPSTPQSPGASRDNTRAQLRHLQDEHGNLARSLDRLLLDAEVGSLGPDGSVYEAPVRIDRSQLLLERTEHDAFHRDLSQTLAVLANVAMWTGLIARENPALAYRLGERMNEPLEGLGERLNVILAEGRSIRSVVQEVRPALMALADAIDAELRTSNA